MAAKRPNPKPNPPSITDEWGIYDPAKAGMPALFARLGRPVLTAAPTNARRERRRALRPERSGEGVGLAIAEARKRAGLLDEDEHPGVGGNPARAVRMALRAQPVVDVAAAPAATALVPPPQPLPVAVAPSPVEAPAPKKRPSRKGVQRRATDEAPEAVATQSMIAAPVVEEPQPEPAATRGRGRRAPARGRAVPATEPPAPVSAVVTAAPLPPPGTVASAAKPVVPAPSPRRPRGPVPLAAWAHAVVEAPRAEPRGADKRGFWRGIFRIPTEVALVEYAHGAKIHRLVIEAGDDLLPDFI